MRQRLTIRAYSYLGVLVVCLVAAVGPSTLAEDATADNGGGFVDIEGNVHEENIKYIVNRGLTVGCDRNGPRYCPDRTVTRAEIATFLARALRLDTNLPFMGVYADVVEGAWYTRFVEAMGSYGLADTEVSGSYRPNDPMLRSEMAIFLQKAFRLPLPEEMTASSFQDIPANAPYGQEAEAILKAGITRGCGTDPLRYCPADTVERDTMASFLARALRASDLEKVLALAPDRETFQTISVGEDTWKVWVCKDAAIREDPVVYLNREIASYYYWLSGGKYRMRFQYGVDPSPAVTAVLENCDSREHLKPTPEGANVFIGGDLWTIGPGVVGVGRPSFDPQSQAFSRNVWMDKRAMYDTTGYIHEIGHTWGWPHNLKEVGASQALYTRMDIMASDREVMGTNAHNLFQLGWIDPDDVAHHPGGSVTYTIAPPHSEAGINLLMLPVAPGRLISIGARAREGFDANIYAEGVELYDIAFCGGPPGCKQVFLPPGAPSSEAVVLDVGESWTARIPTIRQGRDSQTEYIVSVLDRKNSVFTIKVEETSMVDGFSSIGVGRNGVCGLLNSGTVQCWDWRGVDPPPKGAFTSLSVGHAACGIRVDGSIECWGRGSDGTAPPEGEFTTLSVNGYHACGLLIDGTVKCWGSDHNLKPMIQAPGGGFISVSAGWSHACGIGVDRRIRCWGGNYAGETSPPDGRFLSVSGGGFFSCGLRPDNSVTCWGSNENGKSRPPAGHFKSIGTGWNHACGIRANGAVECWGTNDHGEATSPGGVFLAISVGDARTCGLRPDLTVECWGRNRLAER